MNHYKNTLIAAFLAGVSISIGGFVFLMTENRYLGALLFSVGLFLVCTMNMDLFTGKICYLFQGELFTIPRMAAIWLGNLAGAFLMGKAAAFAQPSVIERVTGMCENKLAEGWRLLPLAVLCNVMIYFAVESYKNNSHELGKYLGLVLGVVVFIVCGFEHCVANMFYFSAAGLFVKGLPFLLLNTLGNAAGGIAIHRLNSLRK